MLKSSTALMTAIICVMVALGPIGCAGTTTITSEPNGARLRVDGAPVGTTPYTLTDNAVWLWTKHSVSLEKRGYEPTQGLVAAQVSTTYLIAGIVLFICTFFGGIVALIGEYRPTYNFRLIRKSSVDTMRLSHTGEVNFSDL